MPIYLDCNATTPIELDVRTAMDPFLGAEIGNAGSRTHEFGTRAKRAVNAAREQVATLVNARPEEVVFTSGATESNNLALLGLESYGRAQGKVHIISSAIEHKAVLEPLEELEKRGFEVTLLSPDQGGWIEPSSILSALREDTLLVSIMHVNNETGVTEPVNEISAALKDHAAYFHVDAAQGFGKLPDDLQDPRIDLISASGHKIYGPKGIGALICRRRGYEAPPLRPLLFGGGQERGLRPGTLPVADIVGFGVACELAGRHYERRAELNASFGEQVRKTFDALGARIHGDPKRLSPNAINLSVPGLDSEALILALKDQISISNGSACTSQNYEPSHVLTAMGLSGDEVEGAIRISWCHMTEAPDWGAVQSTVRGLMP